MDEMGTQSDVWTIRIFIMMKGGVHICKLANGNLTHYLPAFQIWNIHIYFLRSCPEFDRNSQP